LPAAHANIKLKWKQPRKIMKNFANQLKYGNFASAYHKTVE